MADSYSSALKARKIELHGYDPDWATRFNADVVDIIDAAIDGKKTISVGSSTSYSLAAMQNGTLSDSHYWWLVFTGTPASAVTVTVPASVTTKEYLLDNQTGQALTFKYSATTGVTLQSGDKLRVQCDGTTVIESPTPPPPRFEQTAAEVAASVTPSEDAFESDDTGQINIKRYGASASQSDSTNKTILQTAISVADEVSGTGSCTIVVPQDCEYGYDQTDLASHPDFSGVAKDMLIIDHTPGSTNVAPAKDGMQVRYWFHTPQTSPVGQHSGNGLRVLGDWAPYLWVDNSGGGPQSPRTSDDNRRASLFFGRDGVAAWRFGMGTLNSISASDDALSNLAIYVFDGPLVSGSGKALVTWSLTTGNMLCNTDSNGETANYHFKARSSGYNNVIVESLTTTAQIVLRNSDGSGDDQTLRNADGAFQLANANGNIIESTLSTRYVGLGLTPAFKLDVLDSRASNYAANISNSSATDGSALRIRSASAAGTGFDLLTAVSDYDGTPDTEFKLRGDGTGLCDGSWTGGGADYAEYFEWADGNPDGEDRRGVSVAVVDGKIRPARSGERPIGVISSRPTVVGDAGALRWSGKYLTDDFGDYITEPVERDGVVVQRRKLNPAYDPDAVYVPREERKEWACVGLMGKLRVRNDQIIGSHWIKLRDISSNVAEWLVT